MRLGDLEENRVERTAGLAREGPVKVEGASSVTLRVARAGGERREEERTAETEQGR